VTHAKEPDGPDEPTAPEDMAPAPEEAAAEPEAAEPEAAAEPEVAEPAPARRRVDWGRVLAYGVLPGVALVLAAVAGVARYVDTTARDDARAGAAAMATAESTAVTMLSYSPTDVDAKLNAAAALLTGDFRGQYLGTIHNTVIPGAQQQQISAVTKVPAAAVVSATAHRAVVMLYLDQTVTVGDDAPSRTLSSARATLTDVDGRWLISEFLVT
jgi:Mce-associated membrane protein